MKDLIKCLVPVFALAVVLAGVPVYAAHSGPTLIGTGTGCSAIEHFDATHLVDGDMFIGRINLQSVTGEHHKGKKKDGTDRELDNSDADAYMDSLEECINDALHGYCTTLGGDDDILIVEVVDCAANGLGKNKPGKEGCFKFPSIFLLSRMAI